MYKWQRNLHNVPFMTVNGIRFLAAIFYCANKTIFFLETKQPFEVYKQLFTFGIANNML